MLKDGRSADSTNENDWDIYRDLSKVHFTNRGSIDGYITITDDTVIRLVYDTRSTTESFPADFYDYDISSRQNSDGTWRTDLTGINSKSNYGTSRNGERTYNSHCDVLAFGNDNTGTGLSRYKFSGVFLNQYSTHYKLADGTVQYLDNPDLFGCTFGLADSLQDGKIVYNPWIVAPNLFNDGTATGKTAYLNSSLGFSRVGDTYTLSTATVNSRPITELEYLFNPSPSSTTTWGIFTNDFWPMDVVQGTDPKLGDTSLKYKGLTPFNYSGGTTQDTNGWKTMTGSLPASDDGNPHNCFFGMNYAVEFTLTSDYVGPLEYYFFGDDDMWVFLDDQLVCDIGGVHSAVGEYVNLWDYVSRPAAGEKKTYTLTFFYTERGASGSTCYMNFTLPSVSGVTTQQESGNLRVEKEVVGLDNGQDFEFTIQFFDEDGNVQPDDYSYTKHLKNGGTETDLVMHEGTIFTLKAGESIEVERLPYGIRYEITETDYSNSASGEYSTAWRTDEGITHTGRTATGSILKSAPNNISTVHFTNTATPNTHLNVKKAAPDGTALSGAAFTLTDSKGKPVEFTKTADGNYTVYHKELYPEIKDGAEYYIAWAADGSWVIGQDTYATTFDAKLQKKSDNKDTQKVKVYHQADGSYSFQSVSNGKWLDLDNGNTDNGHLVHFYQNADTPTTHDNQKWYLLNNGDGSYRVKPKAAVKNGSSAMLDLNTGKPSAGQVIQAYENNGSAAQQWKLVPVNPVAKPDTVTELAVSGQGQLYLNGLIPGTYTLTETRAPDHYQQLTEPITITVDREGGITLVSNPESLASVQGKGDSVLLQVVNKPENVTLTLTKQVVGLTDVTREFPFKITYRLGTESTEQMIQLAHGKSETITIPYGAEVTITETNHDGFSVLFKEGEALKANGDSCTFTITSNVTITAENHTGYQLPSTGGVGTGWFTLAGLLLMTGAAALTISRRRAKEGGPE